MSELDILKRHISKPVPFVLKGEDGNEEVIYLKKLNVVQQIKVTDISKKLNKVNKLKDSEDKETYNKLVEEVSLGMIELFKGILLRSMPEADEDDLELFISEHPTELHEVLGKLMPQPKNVKHIETIKKIQEERVKKNVSTEDK